jgi:RNA polymerase sigma factor (sigma-70 family)
MSWLRSVDRWMLHQVLPHQHAYHALARRLTDNAEVARDIVQDVYAELLAGDGWRKARDPKAFVMRIVYCRSVDWVNRQSVVPIHPLPTYEGLAYADFGPDAFERMSGREELRTVLEILDELPKRCREVVTMRRIEELPPKEIARRLGINLTTVERHLARGVTMLADRLAVRGSLRRGRQEPSGTEAARNTK